MSELKPSPAMDYRRHGFPAPRRVVTAPTTFHSSHQEASSQSGGLVETLYNHPNIKIISFTASAGVVSRSSPGRDAVPTIEEEPGSLSWSSQLERTIAVGAFRIYRAPGSVAFLSCGSALQPILPKSQAWCIDEASSKFVLQIRRPQYWRIEIPVTEADDQQRAHALRGVLDQILQFEKTECPFTRTFTVQLPERPQTPVKKRPWTPLRRSFVAAPTPPEESSPTPKSSAIERELLSSSPDKTEETEELMTSKAPEEQQKQPQEDDEEPSSTVNSHEDHLTETVNDSQGQEVDAQVPIVEGPIPNEAGGKRDEIPLTVSSIVKALDAEYLADVKTPAAPVIVPFVEDASHDTSPTIAPSVEDASQQAAPPVAPFLEDAKDHASLRPAPIVEDASHQAAPIIAPFVKDLVSQLPLSEVIEMSEPATEEIQKSPEEKEVGIVEALSLDVEEKIPQDSLFEHKYEVAMALPTASQTGFAEEPSEEAVDHQDDMGIIDATEPLEAEGQSTPYDVHEGSGIVGARRRKLRSFRAGRSITAPPQLTLVTSPPSKPSSKRSPPLSPQETEDTKGSTSPSGSSDSFHSVQSWHSPITPSPPSPPASHTTSPSSTFPYPHDNIVIPKRSSHHRDVSDLTVTPDTKRTWDVVSSSTDESSEESAATAPDTLLEAAEQPDKAVLSDDEATSTAVTRRRPYGRHRATTSSISVGRRALSPLPPAANLFSPTGPSSRKRQYPSPMEAVRRLPMAIITKTCEVLLGPPSHLISLMLKVAARIAAGEWRGIVLGFGEGGEKIPVQWDYSDGEFSSWGDDDDYYMGNAAESVRSNSVADTKWENDDEAAEGSDHTSHSWGVD